MTSSAVTVYSLKAREEFDKIIQVFHEPGDSKLTIRYMGETSTFISGIQSIIKENKVLINIMRNLWHTHQYNQEYISYLLGNYSREEFMTIANKFAQPLQDEVSNEYLAVASNIIFSSIDQPLTSSDLSIFLNVDNATIDRIMPTLGYIHDNSESE